MAAIWRRSSQLHRLPFHLQSLRVISARPLAARLLAHPPSPAQDPYILRNHLGSLECRLCLTLHTNEGSYLAHTQGKKHQTNLARRAAREAQQQATWADAQRLITGPGHAETEKKRFIKIGRPGYKITKVREPSATNDDDEESGGRMGLLFQVHLPEIKEGVRPLHRFMGSFEQHVELQNRAWQYLVVRLAPLFASPASLAADARRASGGGRAIRDDCVQAAGARDRSLGWRAVQCHAGRKAKGGAGHVEQLGRRYQDFQ